MKLIMIKLLICVLVVGFSLSTASAQSRIVTTSGSVFVGSIVDEDKVEIALRTADGIDVTIPRDKIESISYGRLGVQSGHAHTELAGPISGSSTDLSEVGGHISAGFSLGNHGDAGLNIGYHENGYSARVSAIGLANDAFLLQTSLMKGVINSGPLEIKAGLISGYLWFAGSSSHGGVPSSAMYAGPALAVEVLGIFSEVGYGLKLSNGSGYLLYQLGYAYHF